MCLRLVLLPARVRMKVVVAEMGLLLRWLWHVLTLTDSYGSCHPNIKSWLDRKLKTCFMVDTRIYVDAENCHKCE